MTTLGDFPSGSVVTLFGSHKKINISCFVHPDKMGGDKRADSNLIGARTMFLSSDWSNLPNVELSSREEAREEKRRPTPKLFCFFFSCVWAPPSEGAPRPRRGSAPTATATTTAAAPASTGATARPRPGSAWSPSPGYRACTGDR